MQIVDHPADKRPNNQVSVMLLTLLLVLSGAGCRDGQPPGPAAPEVLHEDLSWGPVELHLSAEPATVSLDRDILLTVTLTVPSEIRVTLPPLQDRLEGFILSGTFSSEPEQHNGKTRTIQHIRLTPVLAETYRLAPFAVEYEDRSRSPAETGWFPTRPLTFSPASPPDEIPNDIDDTLHPIRIYPPARSMAGWLALMAGIFALLWGLVRLVRRVKHHVQLARMSPRERALRELSALLSKDLVRQNLIKDFYVELTMIVRRYIERAHRVRAPEQTTEEFLAAVSRDPRFSEEVLQRLQAFLQAADLVKFAAYQPDSRAVDDSITTARNYIEQDAAEDSLQEEQ